MEIMLHVLYSGLGGTTDYVFNLINGDKESCFEHHILFYGIEEVPKEQLKLANQTASSVVCISKNKGYDKTAFSEVLIHIKKIKPSIIILHVNSLILTCSKYKEANLIFTEHQANHLKTKKEWLWSIIAQVKSNQIVCLTQTYQNELKSKLKLFYKAEKNNIIASGIDVLKYHYDNNNSTTLKIGILSRINKFRDHATLISAFNNLKEKNIELHIAGDGPLLSQLRTANKNQNIFFHGNIQQNKIPLFLSNLDIYCQASFGETSSVALMQAQASGLPIIASNVKGINNILDTENCLFVESGDIESYKREISTLVNDETKRINLGKKSLDFAKDNLSHFRMFEAYKKIIGQ